MTSTFIHSYEVGSLVIVKIVSPKINESKRFIVEINPDKTLKLFEGTLYAKILPDHCLIDTLLTEHYQQYCQGDEPRPTSEFRDALNNLEVYSGLDRVFSKPVTAISQVIFI
jgi:hypothetical protein